MDQVKRARSREGKDCLIQALDKKYMPLSKRVREFHRDFLGESSPDDDWWLGIFNNTYGYHISYYRKDSCLLSDYAFILKPSISIIRSEISPEYYGVGPKGIKLLAESDMVWLMASHPCKYEQCETRSSGFNFINCLTKINKTPYYIDTFEDALASYWIENIKNDNSINNSEITRNLNNFLMDQDSAPFSEFLDYYYRYILKSDKMGNISLIESISNERVDLNAGLYYENLRREVKERLLKIQLFQECLNDITGETGLLINLDQILLQIKNILFQDYRSYLSRKSNTSNQQIHEEDKKNQSIANLIFHLWQQKGTFWSYAEGNTVDLSGRDLSQNIDCLHNLSASTPPNQELSAIRMPVWGDFRNIVEKTNIDDPASIARLSNDRFNLLGNYLKCIKKSNFDYEDNLKKIDEISRINDPYKLGEKINNRVQWSPADEKKLNLDYIRLGSFAISLFLPFGLLNEMGLGMVLESTAWIFNHRSDMKRMYKYGMDTYAGAVYYYKIENTVNNIDLISDISSFNIQTIQLPYQRKNQQFSGKEIPSLGSDIQSDAA